MAWAGWLFCSANACLKTAPVACEWSWVGTQGGDLDTVLYCVRIVAVGGVHLRPLEVCN
jgi:hypothetical protein